MSSSQVPQKLRIFNSGLCLGCIGYIGNTVEEDRIPLQIIPVNPEIYVEYFCAECFLNLPIEEILKDTRAYLISEKAYCKEFIERWSKEFFPRDPLRGLEDSIRFLRGERRTPPFACATFLLHSKHITGHPRIRHRGHLALISFN